MEIAGRVPCYNYSLAFALTAVENAEKFDVVEICGAQFFLSAWPPCFRKLRLAQLITSRSWLRFQPAVGIIAFKLPNYGIPLTRHNVSAPMSLQILVNLLLTNVPRCEGTWFLILTASGLDNGHQTTRLGTHNSCPRRVTKFWLEGVGMSFAYCQKRAGSGGGHSAS